eukprot:380058-Rhodomonas_salina.1
MCSGPHQNKKSRRFTVLTENTIPKPEQGLLAWLEAASPQAAPAASTSRSVRETDPCVCSRAQSSGPGSSPPSTHDQSHFVSLFHTTALAGSCAEHANSCAHPCLEPCSATTMLTLLTSIWSSRCATLAPEASPSTFGCPARRFSVSNCPSNEDTCPRPPR